MVQELEKVPALEPAVQANWAAVPDQLLKEQEPEPASGLTELVTAP